MSIRISDLPEIVQVTDNDVFIVNSSVYLPYILHVVEISKTVYQ